MDQHPDHPPVDPVAQVTEFWRRSFQIAGLDLSDPTVVAAQQRTLEIVAALAEGALKENHVTPESHEAIRDILRLGVVSSENLRRGSRVLPFRSAVCP